MRKHEETVENKTKQKKQRDGEETNQSPRPLKGQRSCSVHHHVSCVNVTELIALFLYDLVTRFPFLHHNDAARNAFAAEKMDSVCWQLCQL